MLTYLTKLSLTLNIQRQTRIYGNSEIHIFYIFFIRGSETNTKYNNLNKWSKWIVLAKKNLIKGVGSSVSFRFSISMINFPKRISWKCSKDYHDYYQCDWMYLPSRDQHHHATHILRSYALPCYFHQSKVRPKTETHLRFNMLGHWRAHMC